MTITVKPWMNSEGHTWHATAPTPDGWFRLSVPGVLGENGPGRPFLEGFGTTPEQAIADLERAFGRALLAAMGKGVL